MRFESFSVKFIRFLRLIVMFNRSTPDSLDLFVCLNRVGADITLLREREVDYDLDRNTRKIAEVLVRKVPDDQQVKVCFPTKSLTSLCGAFFQTYKLTIKTYSVLAAVLLCHGTVPGPARGRAGERGLREVDPAGRPDAGRAGQRPRTSTSQSLQTSARDPDRTHVQHQLRDPRLQQQRRSEF